MKKTDQDRRSGIDRRKGERRKGERRKEERRWPSLQAWEAQEGFRDRRTGEDRRKGERRSGQDRRALIRRAADRTPIMENHDNHLWRGKWPE